MNRIKSLLKDIGNKGFFHLLSANILIRILGFGSQLFVIKFLTPLELGQIRTMQSFAALALVVATLGFDTAVLKICSEKRLFEEKAFILKKNLQYSLLSTFIIYLAFLISSRFELLSPDEGINNLIPFFMLALPASTVGTLLINFVQAIKEIKFISTLQIAFRIFGVFQVILLTYLFGIGGFIASSVIVGYYLIPFIYKFIRKKTTELKVVKNIFRLSFYYARWSLGANIVQTLGQQLDILLLNFLILDRVGFGVYSVATIFTIPLKEITKTIRSIATPYFSEKWLNKTEFFRVLKKYEKLMFFLSLTISIISAIIVPLFITIIYGPEYSDAGLYFQILVLSYFFHSNGSLIATSLLSLGLMKYNFFSSTIYVPLSIGLGYFFISFYGIIGASIALASTNFFAMITIKIVSQYALKKHFSNQGQSDSDNINKNI